MSRSNSASTAPPAESIDRHERGMPAAGPSEGGNRSLDVGVRPPRRRSRLRSPRAAACGRRAGPLPDGFEALRLGATRRSQRVRHGTNSGVGTDDMCDRMGADISVDPVAYRYVAVISATRLALWADDDRYRTAEPPCQPAPFRRRNVAGPGRRPAGPVSRTTGCAAGFAGFRQIGGKCVGGMPS